MHQSGFFPALKGSFLKVAEADWAGGDLQAKGLSCLWLHLSHCLP